MHCHASIFLFVLSKYFFFGAFHGFIHGTVWRDDRKWDEREGGRHAATGQSTRPLCMGRPARPLLFGAPKLIFQNDFQKMC